MDHLGNAIVTWSGYGTEPGHEDTSGYGVFVRRLTTTLLILGSEERINRETAGMQWLPSVAMDGEGNFVVAWTGDGIEPGTSNVYQYLGIENRSVDGPLASDYTVFVHLVGAGGDDAALAQGDGPPLDGRWPTSLWPPGLTLDDNHTVPLPENLAAGTYQLLVGLYDPATGERLRLPDGRDAVRLDGVEIGE